MLGVLKRVVEHSAVDQTDHDDVRAGGQESVQQVERLEHAFLELVGLRHVVKGVYMYVVHTSF